MDKYKSMKDTLVAQVQTQLGNLENVDAKELGEVVDMIKDLEEAMYYCSITKAMNESERQKSRQHYYSEPYYYDYEGRISPDYRDMDRDKWNRMYYGGQPVDGNHMSRGMESMGRDRREGRSPMSRRSYMESKEMHQDRNYQLKELENYMKELSSDITEMIADASPEEKQLLKQKMTTLMSKIV